MLNESLLWARTISPTGRIVKEETFLGAVFTAIGGTLLIVGGFLVLLWLGQFI